MKYLKPLRTLADRQKQNYILRVLEGNDLNSGTARSNLVNSSESDQDLDSHPMFDMMGEAVLAASDAENRSSNSISSSKHRFNLQGDGLRDALGSMGRAELLKDLSHRKDTFLYDEIEM